MLLIHILNEPLSHQIHILLFWENGAHRFFVVLRLWLPDPASCSCVLLFHMCQVVPLSHTAPCWAHCSTAIQHLCEDVAVLYLKWSLFIILQLHIFCTKLLLYYKTKAHCVQSWTDNNCYNLTFMFRKCFLSKNNPVILNWTSTYSSGKW